MSTEGGEVARWEDEVAAYQRARSWLTGAIHELPAGVLWGADGADAEQCAEMREGLEDFARQCARLGLEDHADFIEGCRWHFEHYPHYLGRRRHFVDYATYVNDRHGPLQVSAPEVPRRLSVR